jgi:hypothetical protein
VSSLRPFVIVSLAASVAAAAFAAEPVYTREGLGLSGYDAVAYFTDSKAVKGSPRFEQEWGGVRWRFGSAAHLKTFAASPAKYAPQYGGYCAFGVSRNKLVPGDPEAWKVVGGKLYVNYDRSVLALWEKELPNVVGVADENWPGVLTNREH